MLGRSEDLGWNSLYIDGALLEYAALDHCPFEGIDGHQRVNFELPVFKPVEQNLHQLTQTADSIIIGLNSGLPRRNVLMLTSRLLLSKKRVWFYWNRESSTQRISTKELWQYGRCWLALNGLMRARAKLTGKPLIDGTDPTRRIADEVWQDIDKVAAAVQPIPFVGLPEEPSPETQISGLGIYLRSDFWVRIRSGGSYGHTCYVAKELAATTERLKCVMAQPYEMLDDLGLNQIILEAPGEDGNDLNILSATKTYFQQLEKLIVEEKPAYIYERLALGSYSASKISQKYKIPLIVEYNGSEISMKRSFDGIGYAFEDLYLLIEETVLRQATIIVVVSEQIRNALIRRGFSDDKILVNPNGVDPDDYQPADAVEKIALRQKLGWSKNHIVVGFTGSFGGWHGVEVIAEALPQICETNPEIRILLIGDGNYRSLVETAIENHALQDRVHLAGNVSQAEGAELLKLCDIFLSPHSRHMVDSRFFGSPTKLFEYLAMGGGIIASDLEQIGEVMRPALNIRQLDKIGYIGNERGILVKPGSAEDLVTAVSWLTDNPDKREHLGKNARRAAIDLFSWKKHIGRIWAFMNIRYGKYHRTNGHLLPLVPRTESEEQEAVRHWFEQLAEDRYNKARWMPRKLDLDRKEHRKVLEIGPGRGFEAVRLAQSGAMVTLLDNNTANLAEAQKNFELHDLKGEFIEGDLKDLPFETGTFDAVYAINVIPYANDPEQAVDEIYRVLKPGGKVYAALFSAGGLEYYIRHLYLRGMRHGLIEKYSMAEILGRSVDLGGNEKRGLVDAYLPGKARSLFKGFKNIRVSAHGLNTEILPPRIAKWVPRWFERFLGWTLIVRARKPRNQSVIAQRKRQRTSQRTPPSLKFELVHQNLNFREWLKAKKAKPKLYATLSKSTLERLHKKTPGCIKRTIAAGDTILTHTFDLLGSGPFKPNDLSRKKKDNGYQPIDWYLDPVRNLRFPRGIPHKQWDLYAMRPGNADIKYPWELGRCQHWITLAQAWMLTKEHKYAQEIADQLLDFLEANPVGIGVNWTCTMDVAIRAANWALALECIEQWPGADEQFWSEAYGALFKHGSFIYDNFENNYEVTSNHFLSNIVGLHFVSAVFADCPQGQKWESFCRKALEEEIEKQILPDGADYESSVPYHRLVTELFLASARLADWQGRPLCQTYLSKLEKMVDFHFSMLRPDGRMINVGDCDNGRFHIFTDYGTWDPQDGRHLLSPAYLTLNRDRKEWIASAGGETGIWEATWFGFDPEQFVCGEDRPHATTELYPDAGIAVSRQNGNFLAITNGRVGTEGFGNHKHNDQLGFEWHWNGQPIIIDPGSYVYTSDFDARNRFRSTAYHNTVIVDDVEQNELRPDWIFRMFDCGLPEHLKWRSDGDIVDYAGRHIGYQRLDAPLIHDRFFRFCKRTGNLLFVDRFSGQGQHKLRWHFHCAEEINIEVSDSRVLLKFNKEKNISLTAQQPYDWTIADAQWSPSYGIAKACKAIECRETITLDGNPVIRAFAFVEGAFPDKIDLSSQWQNIISEFEVLDLPMRTLSGGVKK